jgi:ribose 5-phosphate isomerase B
VAPSGGRTARKLDGRTRKVADVRGRPSSGRPESHPDDPENRVKVAIAADHAGYPLKATIAGDLQAAGHEVLDLGTTDPSVPSDYPDVAERVCQAVLDGRAERGIALCGSGVGVSVAANKFPGIRAGVCHDHYSAHQAVEHDDMNVLCVGARVVGDEVARELVRAFAGARFSNETRHARRLAKVLDIEQRFSKR